MHKLVRKGQIFKGELSVAADFIKLICQDYKWQQILHNQRNDLKMAPQFLSIAVCKNPKGRPKGVLHKANLMPLLKFQNLINFSYLAR